MGMTNVSDLPAKLTAEVVECCTVVCAATVGVVLLGKQEVFFRLHPSFSFSRCVWITLQSQRTCVDVNY